MKGRVHGWTEPEQALRAWTAAQRAAFSLKQRLERQEWEANVLAPAQARVLAEIGEGRAPVIELPELT